MIVDLGTDMAPDKFVKAAQYEADIIRLPALVTTSMPGMESAVKTIRKTDLGGHVRNIVEARQ